MMTKAFVDRVKENRLSVLLMRNPHDVMEAGIICWLTPRLKESDLEKRWPKLAMMLRDTHHATVCGVHVSFFGVVSV